MSSRAPHHKPRESVLISVHEIVHVGVVMGSWGRGSSCGCFFPHRWEMADTEPQEVAPGVPDNDLMNALRYDSAHSRTRHPCRIDVIPRARPPDAHLQIPARARQERPIGQSRQPPNQAQRTCLKNALTCILTGLTLSACSPPCAPPPARQHNSELPAQLNFTSSLPHSIASQCWSQR